jgi:hypothetical protein
VLAYLPSCGEAEKIFQYRSGATKLIAFQRPTREEVQHEDFPSSESQPCFHEGREHCLPESGY